MLFLKEHHADLSPSPSPFKSGGLREGIFSTLKDEQCSVLIRMQKHISDFYIRAVSEAYIAIDLIIYQTSSNNKKLSKYIIYYDIEGFSFQIKLFSFPLLDNYRRSFRTFGPHQYSANNIMQMCEFYTHIYSYVYV